MDRNYDQNSPVVYVDPKGERHAALVTVWWNRPPVTDYVSSSGEPGCNVVFVTSDDTKKDPYGSQIERATSVVHKTKQAAPGNFWCWPDEI